MTDSKKILKSTLVYFLGNVLSKIIVFFMLPIYTAYIPASDMGYYDSAIAVITFFTTVLFLDIGIGIMRFMFEKEEREDTRKTIYSGMTIFFSSLLIYTTLALISGLSLSIEYYIWIALYGFIYSLNNIYGYVARGYGANILYAFSGIISTIVNIICNIIFILILGWDYRALYISFCISMLAHIIILEFKCKIIINFSIKYFDTELIKQLLKFSLPLSINNVAYWLLTSANKVIVSSVLDTTQNGYLAIATKFTSIIFLFSTCFQLAWQELAFSKDNNIEDESIGLFYSKAFDLYIRIMFIGLLLAVPLINIIFPYIININYIDSSPLIPLALFGTILIILTSFLGSIFGGIKKTKIIFTSTLAGAIVNLIIIYSLINIIGVMAANYALIAGFAVNLIIRIIMLNKYVKLKVKYSYIILFIPLFIGVNFVYNNFYALHNFATLIVIFILSIYLIRKEIYDIITKLKRTKEI